MATAEELRREAEELRRWASSEREPACAMSLAAEAENLMWAASSQERAEREGRAFFDYQHSWLPARQRAVMAYRRACERSRRKKGDLEIARRLEELEGKERPGGYKITPARRKLIAAVVRTASNSGRIYCSYLALARKAGVSARTACTVRAELESLGVLERVRTGGQAADGTRRTNKYTVKWNALRDALGIVNRWESKYPDSTVRLTRDNGSRRGLNVFFSYEGCAHYSRSERQRRRIAKRLRDLEAVRRTPDPKPAGSCSPAPFRAADAVENACLPGFGVVENRPILKDSSIENVSDLRFCALTELQTQNKPLIRPGTSPQSEQEGENRGGTAEDHTRAALDRLSPEARKRILAEAALFVAQTYPYATPERMTLDFLEAVLGAEKP